MRNALDSLERVQGPGTRERLGASVSKRLSPLITNERLRATAPLDVMSVEEAEDVLFAIDGILGHGAGTSMEDIAFDVVSRAIADGVASVSTGDLAGTMLRLQNLLESPFVDVNVLFEINRSAEGFTLAVGVSGRPRATRLLRHYATGAIRAAARFAREFGVSEPRLSGESVGDRARISVVVRDDLADGTPPPTSQPRTKAAARSSGAAPKLSAEVERILGSRGESGPPPRTPSSYPPRVAVGRPGRPQ